MIIEAVIDEEATTSAKLLYMVFSDILIIRNIDNT